MHLQMLENRFWSEFRHDLLRAGILGLLFWIVVYIGYTQFWSQHLAFWANGISRDWCVLDDHLVLKATAIVGFGKGMLLSLSISARNRSGALLAATRARILWMIALVLLIPASLYLWIPLAPVFVFTASIVSLFSDFPIWISLLGIFQAIFTMCISWISTCLLCSRVPVWWLRLPGFILLWWLVYYFWALLVGSDCTL